MSDGPSLVGEVDGLKALRKLAERSQSALADHLGIRQPSIHKIENQADIYLSTLRRYVEGLGGTLEIRIGLPGLGDFIYKPQTTPARLDEAADYATACALIVSSGRAKESHIQRELGVGYNTAANWIKRMERDGLVGPADRLGRRDIYHEGDSKPPRLSFS